MVSRRASRIAAVLVTLGLIAPVSAWALLNMGFHKTAVPLKAGAVGAGALRTATDPAIHAAAEILKKSPTIQDRFGGDWRDLTIRNRGAKEPPIEHPEGGQTTAMTEIKFKTNDEGKTLDVQEVTIVVDPTDPETGKKRPAEKVFKDVATELGHAANAVDNPEAEAGEETPEQHAAAEERGEEIAREAKQVLQKLT